MARHFLLQYRYCADYMQKRDACRAEHLGRIRREVAAGRILAAGVLPDGPAAAVVFYVEDEAEVRTFAEQDPYMAAGLITDYEVSPWLVAAGIESFVNPRRDA